MKTVLVSSGGSGAGRRARGCPRAHEHLPLPPPCAPCSSPAFPACPAQGPAAVQASASPPAAPGPGWPPPEAAGQRDQVPASGDLPCYPRRGLHAASPTPAAGPRPGCPGRPCRLRFAGPEWLGRPGPLPSGAAAPPQTLRFQLFPSRDSPPPGCSFLEKTTLSAAQHRPPRSGKVASQHPGPAACPVKNHEWGTFKSKRFGKQTSGAFSRRRRQRPPPVAPRGTLAGICSRTPGDPSCPMSPCRRVCPSCKTTDM